MSLSTASDRKTPLLNRNTGPAGLFPPQGHPNTTLLGFRVFFGVEQLEADSLSIGRIFAGSAVALGLEAQIAAWRLRLQPGGSDCSLEAQIESLGFIPGG